MHILHIFYHFSLLIGWNILKEKFPTPIILWLWATIHRGKAEYMLHSFPHPLTSHWMPVYVCFSLHYIAACFPKPHPQTHTDNLWYFLRATTVGYDWDSSGKKPQWPPVSFWMHCLKYLTIYIDLIAFHMLTHRVGFRDSDIRKTLSLTLEALCLMAQGGDCHKIISANVYTYAWEYTQGHNAF